MTYKASLDNMAKGITIAVTILFAVIIAGEYATISHAERAIPISTTIIFLLIYFLVFIFRPVSYIVTSEELIVHRPLFDVKIKRADINSVQSIDEKTISGSIRTFGVGGLFGYYGKFANAGLGGMTWYATRKDKLVLIKTADNKKIIVTPDDPDNFVAEFSASKYAGR